MRVALLINQLKESHSQQILTRMEGKFEKYNLVIVDELGYISFDRWEEIFSDTVMTAAIIDRITHKSYLLNMNGLQITS